MTQSMKKIISLFIIVLFAGNLILAPALTARAEAPFDSWDVSLSGTDVVFFITGSMDKNQGWYAGRIEVAGAKEPLNAILFNSNNDKALDAWSGAINGSSVVKTAEVDGNIMYFSVTVSVPTDYFTGDTAELSFNGETKSLSLSSGTDTKGNDSETKPSEESGSNSESTGDSEGKTDPADETKNSEASDGTGDKKSTDGSEDKNSDTKTETETGKGNTKTPLTPNVSGQISIDGESYDWANVSALSSSSNLISSWKAARDTDGDVYLIFTGQQNTQWAAAPLASEQLTITQNGKADTFLLSTLNGKLNTTPGVTFAEQKNASHNFSAPYNIEIMFPASYFEDSAAVIEAAGTSASIDSLPVLDGTPVEAPAPTKYEGITIDGDFTDWAPVAKSAASDPNQGLESVAAVWDGDSLYIYIKEVQGSLGAYHAGSHSNGKFALTTDCGYTQLIQFNYDGTISSSISGISSKHVGSEWEIAIPTSGIASYKQSVSFGLYLADPMLSGITNMNSSSSGTTIKKFSNIVYDGNFSDWTYYPHTVIEYDTPGTQETIVDGEGALYSSGDTLYGHVYTQMADHTQEGGGEFTQAVTFNLNGTTFYPRFFIADSNGNIKTWDPKNLPAGDYTLYIVDIAKGYDGITNISQMDGSDPWGRNILGQMKVSLSSGRDECEFYLDYEALAQHYNCDATDFKEVTAQFGRIGHEELYTAGASSGPWGGVLLSIGSVLGVFAFRRKKRLAAA